jgi:hypothetical protein
MKTLPLTEWAWMTDFRAMPTLSQKGYFAHFPALVTPIQWRIAAW